MKKQYLFWCLTTVLAFAALMTGFWLVPERGDSFALFGFFGFGMLSILLLGLRDGAVMHREAKMRMEGMQEAATRLGFSFYRSGPLDISKSRPDAPRMSFALYESGSLLFPRIITMATSDNLLELPKGFHLTRSHWWSGEAISHVKNAIVKNAGDVSVAVFDLQKNISDRAVVQTVLAVQSPRLEFPHFELAPIGSWDRLIEQCHGNCPVDQDTFSWMLDKSVCLEAGDGFLLFYRKKKLIAPEDVDLLLTAAMHVYAALCEASDAPSSAFGVQCEA